jgi:hypothetical protein
LNPAADAAVEETRRARELRSKAIQVAADARREQDRLDRLRQYGRTQAYAAPELYRARVQRELLSFVSTEGFPPDLDDYSAYALIRARVGELLEPWRDEESRKQMLARLIGEGRSHAMLVTISWSYAEANEAKKAVQEALDREVATDWSISDVKALVDEVLAEWSEDDDDD